MTPTNSIQARPVSTTDSLINGLIGGILAGIGMLVWLLLAGPLGGESPQAVLE